MAPTKLEAEHGERLARIEQKLDDFISMHNGGCPEVQVNRNWLRGLSAVMSMFAICMGVAFLHLSDKIDKIHELLPYSPFLLQAERPGR